MGAPANSAMRLAVRSEGGVVNAYLAPPETMKGAIHVYSVQHAIADLPGVREKLLELGETICRAVMADIGLPVARVEIQEAPEHERPGHA